ncbi:MAG: hypothetical protein J2P17_11680, partial [Mycobacterium sp.]|nr:hypothetical protein [Mycobacterium sp.]
MTGHPRSTILQGGQQGDREWTKFADAQDIPGWVPEAYADTYQGPHVDVSERDRTSAAPGPTHGPAAVAAVTPALLGAHYRLGRHRPEGESQVAIYLADDPAGFGPAIQVVTDYGAMLMDSVTVLLHRL